MNMATIDGDDAADDHVVVRSSGSPPARTPFLDDGGLQVELHPRRDGRADQADEHHEDSRRAS